MKPNVLQLIDSFHEGGTERQAIQLTRLLHETGRYRLHVACLTNEGVLKQDVERLQLGPIHAFPTVSFFHPSIAPQLARFVRLLRELRIDLIHAHDFYTNILGMAAAAIASVSARIASRRETDPGRTRAQRWVEHRAFDAAHAVVVNANAISRELVAAGVPARKIHTVYNGVDGSRFEPARNATRDQRLAALAIPAGRHSHFVTILANLRLVLKDHPTFLRAARKVRMAVPDAAFIIAGEGELVESLRRMAGELELADAVYFTGRCQQVADLLAASDVGVLSSVSEGFPNVLIEYMAAGRAVVTTDVGGAKEAVRDGETGFVIAPRDADAMADRISWLLTHPSERATMGARGREIALKTFSCAAQLDSVERLYDQLMGRRAASPGRRLIAHPSHHQESVAAPEDIVHRPAASRVS